MRIFRFASGLSVLLATIALTCAGVAAAPGTSGSERGATGRTDKARVLVVRIEWAGQVIGLDDVKATFDTSANAYWSEVSGGRFATKLRVTKPIRVAKPDQPPGLCFLEDGRFVREAEAKARRQGYPLDRFDVVTYIYPWCQAGGSTDLYLRAIPGILMQQPNPGSTREEYLYQLTRTAIHEEGHAWGLGHSNAWSCTQGGVRVTWGDTCRSAKYGDLFDQMGDNSDPGRAGWFCAPKLHALGWLSGMRTVPDNATVALAPLTSTTGGTRAIRVPGDEGRTYWVELRTATGQDAGLPVDGLGVQLRVDLVDGPGKVPSTGIPTLKEWRNHTSQLLDPSPATGWEDVDLAAGTSWTSPEGITFTTASVTADQAIVTISR